MRWMDGHLDRGAVGKAGSANIKTFVGIRTWVEGTGGISRWELAIRTKSEMNEYWSVSNESPVGKAVVIDHQGFE